MGSSSGDEEWRQKVDEGCFLVCCFKFEVKHVGDKDADISRNRKWKGSHRRHAAMCMCLSSLPCWRGCEQYSRLVLFSVWICLCSFRVGGVPYQRNLRVLVCSRHCPEFNMIYVAYRVVLV